jgi:hypothetical protein
MARRGAGLAAGGRLTAGALLEVRREPPPGLARLLAAAVRQRHRVICRGRVDLGIHVAERLAVAHEQDLHPAERSARPPRFPYFIPRDEIALERTNTGPALHA